MLFRDLLNLLRPAQAVPTDERRETVRLQCRVNALLRAGEAMHFVSVVNVTLSGLCIEVEGPLQPELSVSLARDDFGPPLAAKVLWSKPLKRGAKNHLVGLQYDADPEVLRASWLQPALKQAGFKAEFPGEKRRLLRVPGRVVCQIKGMTGEAYTDAEMLDLSLGGALVESPMEFPLNLTVEFETVPMGGLPPLKGVAKMASIQKANEGGKWRCGLRFTESKEEDIREYMKSMLASR